MKPRCSMIRWVFLFALALVLPACAGPEPDSGSAAGADNMTGRGHVVDVIRLAGGDWGYPTPFAHYPRGPGGFKMALIFDSLLERDEKGLIPWLARSYAIEDNGLAYRFTIRDGVRWQDGTPLTVRDVAFSLDYANRHAATWSHIFGALASVKIAGHDVVVRLAKPRAAMLYNLGITRIIPRHIWEKVTRPKEFTAPEAVIGSGPYRLTHYSKEHGTYRFEANEDFWGPGQRVRVIEYIPVSEPILAYENQEIDLTAVTPDLLPRFQNDTAHKIVQSPGFWGYRLLMNMGAVPCLRDVTLRRAMALAIDLNELVDKIARGAAQPGNPGILPPDHVMADKTIPPFPFDPQYARALLDRGGYHRANAGNHRFTPDGRPLALDLLCGSREVRMAELIRQRLADIGIGLTIRSVDGKTRDARVRAFNYQLAILGHGGWGGDPDYLATRFGADAGQRNAAPSRSGLPGFDSPGLKDLLARQQAEINPERRYALIMDIQQMLARLVPEIPLFYTTGHSIFRPAKYDGWMFMFDHHSLAHGKLSFLERGGPAAKQPRR